VSARKVVGTHWEAQRGDGTPFREFATRKQALEYMREFRRLDATGAGRRVVKVTRYAGREFSQADVEAAVAKAVAAEREACAALCDKRAATLRNHEGRPTADRRVHEEKAFTAEALAFEIRARGKVAP
jgi:hypothetical protein